MLKKRHSFIVVALTIFTILNVNSIPTITSAKKTRLIKSSSKRIRIQQRDIYNPRLTQFAMGSKATYLGDNNRMVLKHFPTSEMDMKDLLHNKYIDNAKNPNVQVLNIQVAPWQVYYYLIQFPNGDRGWVPEGDLCSTSAVDVSVKAAPVLYPKVAQQVALKYVNLIRTRHGLSKLTWNDQLSDIANKRVLQVTKRFAHYDTDGKTTYQDEVAKLMGASGLVGKMGENIVEHDDYTGLSAQQAVIQDINSMAYEDGATSDWEHRKNFLDKNAKVIGIAVRAAKGYYYSAYETN